MSVAVSIMLLKRRVHFADVEWRVGSFLGHGLHLFDSEDPKSHRKGE